MATLTAYKAIDFDTFGRLSLLAADPVYSQETVTGFHASKGIDSIDVGGAAFFYFAVGDKDPLSGLVQSLTFKQNGVYEYVLDDVSISYATLMANLANHSANAVFKALFSGNDTVNAYGYADRIFGYDGNDHLNGGGGNDLLRGGDDTDWVHGNADDDRVFGDAGSDMLYGDGGNDKLKGGAGFDTLDGGTGKDFLDGGADWDTATYANRTDSVVVTLDGNHAVKVKIDGKVEDTLVRVESIFGGSGDDHLTGDGQANSFIGGEGRDVLEGGGNADVLYGLGGRDVLDGGTGADTLEGGLKADTLTGGAAADTFVFSSIDAVDTITDFKHGVDHIALKGYVFTSLFTGFPGTFLLNPESFVHDQAAEADDFIIYKKASGKIFYDADGSGGLHDAIQFAKVDPGTQLSAGDFLIQT